MELQTRNFLIEKHMPWVRELARMKKKSIVYPQVTVEELVAAGNMALVEVADKYDAEQGEFENFARKRILGQMSECLREIAHGYHRVVEFFESLNPTAYGIPAPKEPDLCVFDAVANVTANPKKYRQVLQWRFVENYSYDEIATKLGVSSSRVAQMFAYIKHKVKSRYSPEDLY